MAIAAIAPQSRGIAGRLILHCEMAKYMQSGLHRYKVGAKVKLKIFMRLVNRSQCYDTESHPQTRYLILCSKSVVI